MQHVKHATHGKTLHYGKHKQKHCKPQKPHAAHWSAKSQVSMHSSHKMQASQMQMSISAVSATIMNPSQTHHQLLASSKVTSAAADNTTHDHHILIAADHCKPRSTFVELGQHIVYKENNLFLLLIYSANNLSLVATGPRMDHATLRVCSTTEAQYK